jgi:hypothetical protein
MRLTNWTIDNRMKSLGYYQIAGGIIGILLTIRILITQETINGLILLFILIAFFLYSFSIYCGNLLRKLDLNGLNYSRWNQGLQILQFGLFGVGFKYFSGLFFKFGFNWTESFTPYFELGISSWALSYLPKKLDEVVLYLNIVPIIVLYLISKTEQEIDIRKELIEIASEKPINEIDEKELK